MHNPSGKAQQMTETTVLTKAIMSKTEIVAIPSNFLRKARIWMKVTSHRVKQLADQLDTQCEQMPRCIMVTKSKRAKVYWTKLKLSRAPRTMIDQTVWISDRIPDRTLSRPIILSLKYIRENRCSTKASPAATESQAVQARQMQTSKAMKAESSTIRR